MSEKESARMAIRVRGTRSGTLGGLHVSFFVIAPWWKERYTV